jgi:hypothetical protein
MNDNDYGLHEPVQSKAALALRPRRATITIWEFGRLYTIPGDNSTPAHDPEKWQWFRTRSCREVCNPRKLDCLY